MRLHPSLLNFGEVRPVEVTRASRLLETPEFISKLPNQFVSLRLVRNSELADHFFLLRAQFHASSQSGP